jgi:7-cyano-7-deazaguanine synthase in queuosine biosynthesis
VVTSHVLATPSVADAKSMKAMGGTGVVLYTAGSGGLPCLGQHLPHIVERRLPAPPSILHWDFLSIALAIYASDRFILRQSAPDGWTRSLTVEVALADPSPWQAVATDFSNLLRFLTGDIWTIRFREGGKQPPVFNHRLTDRDCVTLFSGGLDSFIGTLDLLTAGKRPFLVSQATPGEMAPQEQLAREVGLIDQRFDGRVVEHAPIYEPSSRARSLLFIAYGVMAASELGGELLIPENGLISINPPLTSRRIGSLSTRTTHPHFLSSMEGLLHRAGMSVRLRNPYALRTKGEMMRECRHAELPRLAPASYSCGKGKRLHRHCGRCIPCVVRRASFHASGLEDGTIYAFDLADQAMSDDVFSARFAITDVANRSLWRWVLGAGPLPSESKDLYVDVVRRGLAELAVYFHTVDWK